MTAPASLSPESDKAITGRLPFAHAFRIIPNVVPLRLNVEDVLQNERVLHAI
jgi:hypothetical protein